MMRMLADFMNNPLGRLFRIALGVAIVVTAFTAFSGLTQWTVAAVGLVPIALGLSGHCLLELIPGARGVRR